MLWLKATLRVQNGYHTCDPATGVFKTVEIVDLWARYSPEGFRPKLDDQTNKCISSEA